jgi:tetratricopeptide (TPR) repeat protein
MEFTPTSAQVLSTHGLLYYQLEQWPQAMASYRQALDEYQAVDDFYSVGQTCCQLGTMLFQQQQYGVARQWAEMALRFLVKAERLNTNNYSLFRSQYAAALNLLGSANFYQGRHALALRQLEKVISIRCELQDEVGEALTMVMMGQVYQARQQVWYALACYEGALEICQWRASTFDGGWFEAQVRCLIAQLRESCGHWDLALKQYFEALTLRRAVEAGSGE